MSIVVNTASYRPSTKDENFLRSIQSGEYKREVVGGIAKFIEGNVPKAMRSFYTEDELQSLVAVRGTEQDVEARMPVKITRHYFQQAKNSKPLQRLIKADANETLDLEGSPDPGRQLDYSPIEGLIHKYELGLIYVAATCSAHCRFCYREELIASKEIKRTGGDVAAKGLAQIDQIVPYILEHNRSVLANGGIHPQSGRGKMREVLLSGGDPLVLSNRKLGAWLAALAWAGIEQIRIGTKELAFFPDRFDDAFFDMLDSFHALYPGMRLRLMVHFNHPDEFLKTDAFGAYLEDTDGGFQWLDTTRKAVARLAQRTWVAMYNQTPIIKGINGDPAALRILQRELQRNKVENHYFFCGRDVVGYRAFNLPIEEAWRILNESQKGLSGVESHARLFIVHFKGKAEVVAVTNEPLPSMPGSEGGVVIFKMTRSSGDAPDRGKVAIAQVNPEAVWLNEYADRVVFDESGFFDEFLES